MDIFGGQGNFKRVSEEKGFSSKGIDVLYDKIYHDFLTETGFFCILSFLLTVVLGFGFS